jgi:hypothetical protein
VVDLGFEPGGVKILHAAMRIRSKDLLTRNQDNVNEWSDISIRGLLVQCVSTMKRVVNFTMNEQ